MKTLSLALMLALLSTQAHAQQITITNGQDVPIIVELQKFRTADGKTPPSHDTVVCPGDSFSFVLGGLFLKQDAMAQTQAPTRLCPPKKKAAIVGTVNDN